MTMIDAWEVTPYPGNGYSSAICRTWEQAVQTGERSLEYWSELQDDVTVRLRKIRISEEELEEIKACDD